MIRVLHVLGGLNQGGVENLLMNIYRKIDRDKIQFDFLVNRKGFFDEEVVKMGGKIFYIPALQDIGELSYKRNLNNFFKENNHYLIVHSHLNQVSGLILEIAYNNNIPIRISHSHNNSYSINFIARLYKEFLRKKIDKYSNVKFACSISAAKFMFRKYYKEAIIINNGVPIDKFAFDSKKRKEFRKKYRIKENEIVIGHIGRFEKQKNHVFLIKVFKELLKKNKNIRLIMLGTGSKKEKIVKLCNDIKNKVIFIEPNPNSNYFYNGIDMFVFPSLYEGLGMVLIEAQISGLLCYASKDYIPSIVQISNRLKFIPLKNNPREWANIISKDFNNLKKRSKKEMVDNRFDIDEVVKELSNFYINKVKEYYNNEENI